MQRVHVVPRDVAVGQHGALRPSGRSRGVHDQGDIIGLDVLGLRKGLARCDDLFEALPAVAGALGTHEPLAGQLAADLVEGRLVGVVGDDRVHSRVIDDVVELAGRKPEVERHEGCSEARGSEHRDEEGGMVEAQIGDAVPGGDSPLAKRGGQPVDSSEELGVAPGHTLEGERTVGRGQRGTLGNHSTESDVGDVVRGHWQKVLPKWICGTRIPGPTRPRLPSSRGLLAPIDEARPGREAACSRMREHVT